MDVSLSYDATSSAALLADVAVFKIMYVEALQYNYH